MKQLTKQTLIAYLLPVISGLIVLFIPDYDAFFTWLTIGIYLLLIMLPGFLYLKYKSRKNKEIVYRLTAKYMMYAFLLFWTFPILKLFSNNLGIQLLLLAIFISMLYLAKYDQNTEVPIIYPGDGKEHKKIAYVYYALPVLFVIAGGGGNVVAARHIAERLGHSKTMLLFSIVIYLFSCWILFFFSSIIYKSHVKEGFLDK
ncbi:hypothetical protein MHZ95_14495 [Sporosarcina sp. ACRSM]|uniref:hypothetical protein n=1 Tax=Sporosarcina sp. ACRSM TaxID=2918216 RepID=UPI001EF3FD6C|nr:hypothetical protein [Sporosarcina sp. ACRSM]MCG7336476.1 hypothetical protein [Sporosarcina sp. ACRSM]